MTRLITNRKYKYLRLMRPSCSWCIEEEESVDRPKILEPWGPHRSTSTNIEGCCFIIRDERRQRNLGSGRFLFTQRKMTRLTLG
jgi:hypothetical protein